MLWRLGRRAHIAIVTRVTDLLEYRVVMSGGGRRSDALGRRYSIRLANFRAYSTQVRGAGRVHLCPRCVPAERFDEVLVALATENVQLGGDPECPLCAGLEYVTLTPTSATGRRWPVFHLEDEDVRSGTAFVVDENGYRFWPPWVTGPRWTTRDWATLRDMMWRGEPAPASTASTLVELRLAAIRRTLEALPPMPTSAVPVLCRIGALVTGELDDELRPAR